MLLSCFVFLHVTYPSPHILCLYLLIVHLEINIMKNVSLSQTQPLIGVAVHTINAPLTTLCFFIDMPPQLNWKFPESRESCIPRA